MTITYDPATDLGKVRLRIRDIDVSDPTNILFSDEELASFYASERSSWKRCAALCLETIATNEALIQKVIKLLSLSTNGAQLADSLMKQAKELRVQADDEDSFNGDVFDWAEHIFNPETDDERLVKDVLRGNP